MEKSVNSGDVIRSKFLFGENRMMSEMEYRKGNYIARVAVIEWGKQLYKGLVLLRQHGEEQIEQFCVPVDSDNADDALDEARALAHKILDEKVIYGQQQRTE
jgi:hypothetical protein